MKIFVNLAAIALQSFGTAGSCVTVAGGSAARQNHIDRSQNDERTAAVGRPSAAMGSGGEMGGSRAVEANETGRPRVCPHEARDRGQVPVATNHLRLARCPQTGSPRRRIRGAGDGGVLIPRLPTTSPTRPPVAASFSGGTFADSVAESVCGPPSAFEQPSATLLSKISRQWRRPALSSGK